LGWSGLEGGTVVMHRTFDVSAWSLSLPLVVVGACGFPASPASQDTDASGTDASGTDAVGDPCLINEDCPPGYVCNGGMCEYEGCGGCSCANVRPDGDRFRCPGGYYGCYSDSDCDAGVCEDNVCVDVPLPDPCETLPGFGAPISLVFTEPGPVSKAFFASRSDPSDPLFTIRDTQLTRHTAEGESIVITEVGPIVDAVAHDFTGSGALDFVVSSAGETPALTVWRASGEGFAPTSVPGFTASALQIAVGDWDGAGASDLFVRTAEAVSVLPGAGDGTFAAAQQLASVADRMHVSDIDLNGSTELVLGTGGHFELLTLRDGTVLGELGSAAILGTILDDLDGDAFPDLLVLQDPFHMTTRMGPLLDPGEPAQADLTGEPIAMVGGDLGHTAQADLVVAHTGMAASIYYGGPSSGIVLGQPFECAAELQLPLDPTMMAIGDYNQDGTRDLVVSDGLAVVVLPQL
jgi:hypothetical protein